MHPRGLIGFERALDVKAPLIQFRVRAPARPAVKVTIADDEATGRRLLERLLSLEGYEVVSAKNGREAVDLFDSESPDLVLMDVMMPEMDGYEATRRIKAWQTEVFVPVIFLTGVTDEEELARCGSARSRRYWRGRPGVAREPARRSGVGGGRGDDDQRDPLLSGPASIRDVEEERVAGADQGAREAEEAEHLVCCQFVGSRALQHSHDDERELPAAEFLAARLPRDRPVQGRARSCGGRLVQSDRDQPRSARTAADQALQPGEGRVAPVGAGSRVYRSRSST